MYLLLFVCGVYVAWLRLAAKYATKILLLKLDKTRRMKQHVIQKDFSFADLQERKETTACCDTIPVQNVCTCLSSSGLSFCAATFTVSVCSPVMMSRCSAFYINIFHIKLVLVMWAPGARPRSIKIYSNTAVLATWLKHMDICCWVHGTFTGQYVKSIWGITVGGNIILWCETKTHTPQWEATVQSNEELIFPHWKDITYSI